MCKAAADKWERFQQQTFHRSPCSGTHLPKVPLEKWSSRWPLFFGSSGSIRHDRFLSKAPLSTLTQPLPFRRILHPPTCENGACVSAKDPEMTNGTVRLSPAA